MYKGKLKNLLSIYRNLPIDVVFIRPQFSFTSDLFSLPLPLYYCLGILTATAKLTFPPFPSQTLKCNFIFKCTRDKLYGMEQKTFSIPSSLFIIKKFVAIRLSMKVELWGRKVREGRNSCVKVQHPWPKCQSPWKAIRVNWLWLVGQKECKSQNGKSFTTTCGRRSNLVLVS